MNRGIQKRKRAQKSLMASGMLSLILLSYSSVVQAQTLPLPTPHPIVFTAATTSVSAVDFTSDKPVTDVGELLVVEEEIVPVAGELHVGDDEVFPDAAELNVGDEVIILDEAIPGGTSLLPDTSGVSRLLCLVLGVCVFLGGLKMKSPPLLSSCQQRRVP